MSVSQIERPCREDAPPLTHQASLDDARDVASSVANSRRWEALKLPVSLWLAFHVAAVVIYPASILVPERGLLAAIRNTFFGRYMEALYMVQGHRFFAPEPGAGTLVAYEIEHPDGSVTEQVFPRREIRPRLLYHRYFMLSERVQDVDDPNAWYWMYARRLGHVHDGERVTLTRVIHHLPTPDDILAGKPLTDTEFYEYVPLGIWTREELEADAPPPPDADPEPPARSDAERDQGSRNAPAPGETATDHEVQP